jgi:hypothetical protein
MSAPGTAQVDFLGEIYPIPNGGVLTIGREGDLAVDDNPYLHRHFLQIAERNGLYWLSNVGSQLSATVSDENGLMQAWLAPGASIPLVFGHTRVWFTAGPTTYEFDVLIPSPAFEPAKQVSQAPGSTTIGRTSLTPDQILLLLALAEHVLVRGDRGAGSIPSSAEAARRLGWTLTKFNRKLDNVCEKLSKMGIRGLHGEPGNLASSRRARLVEYALASRLISVRDLSLLKALSVDGTDEQDDSPGADQRGPKYTARVTNDRPD